MTLPVTLPPIQCAAPVVKIASRDKQTAKGRAALAEHVAGRNGHGYVLYYIQFILCHTLSYILCHSLYYILILWHTRDTEHMSRDTSSVPHVLLLPHASLC